VRDIRHHLCMTIGMLAIAAMACRLGSTPTVTFTPLTTMQKPTDIPETSTPSPIPPEPTKPSQPQPTQQTVTPPEKSTLALFPEDVRNYLAQGGNPLDIELAEWESYLSADLTGDQVAEDIFVFVDPTSQFTPPTSALIIYQDTDKTTRILKSYVTEDWWGLELVGTSDLTRNGNTDLIFSDVTCGAHTCWHTLHVWTWTGTDFKDSVGTELSFPFPDYRLENDQLLVSSAGVGSVGAGPQRPITTTIAWDGAVITATLISIGPVEYRFHAFVDGDAALRSGYYDDARDAYAKVIQDENLLAWGAFYSADEEQKFLSALAYWRLMNLSVIQDDLDIAARYYEDLKLYTPETPGYAVLLISEQFWQIIEADKGVYQACDTVQTLPEAIQILEFLNNFGYANPYYEPEDLCFSSFD
jgi:hypothetical protein